MVTHERAWKYLLFCGAALVGCPANDRHDPAPTEVFADASAPTDAATDAPAVRVTEGVVATRPRLVRPLPLSEMTSSVVEFEWNRATPRAAEGVYLRDPSGAICGPRGIDEARWDTICDCDDVSESGASRRVRCVLAEPGLYRWGVAREGYTTTEWALRVPSAGVMRREDQPARVYRRLVDVDGDAREDILVLASNGSGAYRVTPDDPGAAPWIEPATGCQFEALFPLPDYTLDGRADVLAVQACGDVRSLLAYSARASYAATPARVELPLSASESLRSVLSLGDHDRDGWPDLAFATTSARGAEVQFRRFFTPGGLVQPELAGSLRVCVGDAPALRLDRVELVRDLNGDGRDELLALCRDGATTRAELHVTSPAVAWRFTLTTALRELPAQVTNVQNARDVNGDRADDLVVSVAGEAALWTWSRAEERYTPWASLVARGECVAEEVPVAVVGRFNVDPTGDVAVGCRDARTGRYVYSWWFGGPALSARASGALAMPSPGGTQTRGASLTTWDNDGDGVSVLVIAEGGRMALANPLTRAFETFESPTGGAQFPEGNPQQLNADVVLDP